MKNILRQSRDLGLRCFLILPSRLREKLIIGSLFVFHPFQVRKNFREKKQVLKSLKEKNLVLYQNAKDSFHHYCLTHSNATSCRRYFQAYQNQGVRCLQRRIAFDQPHDQCY